MDRNREIDEFRRIRYNAEIERGEQLIKQYFEHMTLWRKRNEEYRTLLGHIAERLGDPEPEEPTWRSTPTPRSATWRPC